MTLELSVVATLYQSGKSVEAFCQRMLASCGKVTQFFEIILVNDGCSDDSLIKAKAQVDRDPRIKIVDLSRNFGHHKAIMVGLSYASGEQVFLIDTDLEEPPELLQEFKQHLDAHPELDMVYGLQAIRKGNFFERWSGSLYYRLINVLVDYPIPKNFLTVRLMTSRYVKQLCRYQERELNFATLIALNGFEAAPIAVNKEHRGESTYTLSKKLGILVNTVTSSSSKPLWLIFSLGIVITLISIIAVLFILFRYLFFDLGVAGWTSLIISIWVIGGILILSVGIVGIYLSKIFVEVKQRPYVNVREVIENNDAKK